MRAVQTQWGRMTARLDYSLVSLTAQYIIDPNAVLDGDFKVRGVENLRVVDASTWPIVPGYFVTTPIYMVRTLSLTIYGINIDRRSRCLKRQQT
jgi:hypothetical protein